MYGKSFNKFINYSKLNEISKFSDLNNIFMLTSIKKVSVWLSLDLSLERSKVSYHIKGILGFFLIYLITNKCPTIQSSKNQSLLRVESYLSSSDLRLFLEKFFILYDFKKIKSLFDKSIINKGTIYLTVIDLNIFAELDGYLGMFRFLECIYIDIHCSNKNDQYNFLFLNNLFNSSHLA